MRHVVIPTTSTSGHPVAMQTAYTGDAGKDLVAAEDYLVTNTPTMVRAGVCMAIPAGHVGLVCPRSGLAAKYGVTVTNAPGVIDSGFRGELCVILHTVAPGAVYPLKAGERCAQLLVMPVPPVTLQEMEELDDTERSAKGFGSSGK